MKYIIIIIGVLFMTSIVNADIIFTREYFEDVWPPVIREADQAKSGSGLQVVTVGHHSYSQMDSLAESLRIPIDQDISSKDGYNLAELEAITGIRGFAIKGRVYVSSTRASMILVNSNNEEYRVLVRPAESFSQAWKDFVSRTKLMSLHSSSFVLFQRTSYDGVYAVMGYDPPGINYAITEGPFFVEISLVSDKTRKHENRDARIVEKDRDEKFMKHENNLANIAKQINHILRMDSQSNPNDSASQNKE